MGISDPAGPRLAGVNGNVMMYAASMPKLGILLGAFKRIERGEIIRSTISHMERRQFRLRASTTCLKPAISFGPT